MWAHKKILFSAFSAFLLFVALFVAVVYHSHITTTEINKADKNTLVVLKATEEVFKDMTNLETGYRGYILTSNPIFLQPYQQALSEYEVHLAELNKAELDEKNQQKHVVRLAVLAHTQIQAAKELVTKKQKGKVSETGLKQALVKGKETMDSIRQVASLIENHERVNLAMYDKQKAENARNAFFLVLVFSLIALLVFIGFSVTINKNVNMRIKAEEKLVSMNRQLEQKVADRTLQLQNANDLLSNILNRISDGFVALDNNWCYTYVNKVAGQLLNQPPESLLGKNMWDLFPEGKQTPFYQIYLNAMEKQEACRIEEYFTPWDVWLENHLYPSPNGISIYFSDITQKKKAEQKLEENERNLKQAELAARFGHWKLVVDEKTAYCSDGARIIYGVDKNVFTSEEVMSFRLPEYNNMLNEAMRALIEDNKPFNVEFKIKRQSDGAIVDVQSVAEYNAAERTVFGVIKDITASKNTERALKQEKDLSESIINSLPGVFSMFDDKGRIVRWNKNCETISGYTAAEISKMTTLDFIDRDHMDVAREKLESAF
ncbi:MAG TPA: PAS domain S-box protein, partial [Chitinophagales bacterium]|nr:PAS domain S-box protein [Chitinophagales bacterium]